MIATKPVEIVFNQIIDNIKEVNINMKCRNNMNVVNQQTKQTMIARFHLRLNR